MENCGEDHHHSSAGWPSNELAGKPDHASDSLFAGLAVAALLSAPALARRVNAAVAANFTKPAEEIGAAFTAEDRRHRACSASGPPASSIPQLTQAAPFDVLCRPTTSGPAQAMTEGHGVDGTVFTYAVGKVSAVLARDRCHRWRWRC